jgi:hypothetical protein
MRTVRSLHTHFGKSPNAAYRYLGAREAELDAEIVACNKQIVVHEEGAAELRVRVSKMEKEMDDIAGVLGAVAEPPIPEKIVRPVALHLAPARKARAKGAK